MARPVPLGHWGMPVRRSPLPRLLGVVALALTGCTAGPEPAAAPTAATAPPSAQAVVLPPADGTFDYQIGGAYPPAADVRIVDRDRHGPPAPGRYGVCYVNAFQTQPEDRTWWDGRHPDLLLRDAAGRPVVDEAWNEVLLDLRTPAKRAALAGIVGPWLDGCAATGYRAVELDNLDSWTRSQGLMTYPQARSYAALLLARGHAAGLAVAQKNAVEQAADLHRLGFDLAIVEECQVYDECGAATAVYGRQVYEIEYTDAGGLPNFRKACAARGPAISVLLRDRDVVPRGTDGYVSHSC